MKKKTLFSTLSLAIFMVGCDPIGTTVYEGEQVDEASEALVRTSNEIELKSGDKLVIWGVFSASYRGYLIPQYILEYNLSKGDSTYAHNREILFDHDDNIINSTYSSEEVKEENSSSFFSEEENKTETTTVHKQWEFQQKIIEIPINSDGRYTFDYKVKQDSLEVDASFPKVAIILRKN